MSDPTDDTTSTAADNQSSGEIPNTQTGVGIGAEDEPNTFEPEENPER